MYFFNGFVSALVLAISSTTVHSEYTEHTKSAKVHLVHVGVNSSLVFSPSSVKAKPGDTIHFQFHQKNHSVIQSTFEAPCAPISSVQSNITGFDSGFKPVAADAKDFPIYSVKINNTNTIWASCSQVGHCAKGMVFAVNPPSNGTKTFKHFRSLAMSGASAARSSAAVQTPRASPSSGKAAAASSSAAVAPKATGEGHKELANMMLVMLLAVFGGAFIML
ncbi:hypothetical protein BGW36DRAFT_426813 [Talaromyces proteolyticus]|uniref:Phytocyanin domain-containing protein n=1 Tax=Talaromyces proteolyticus TaxID=1131652 RepID=A0AAD4KXM7_9EURO|nr:uncharacterized protein BGW36DRAFT_426813 [Talaromyces proteolyticus]KAH8699138.1 hypothetical protein BGW36DRAFT_426813 [Talaromyces proteolyticus]